MKSSSTFEGHLTSEISEGIKLTKVGSALLHYAKIGSWVLTIYYVTTIPPIINNVWFDFYFLMSIYIYRPKETGNFFYTRGIFFVFTWFTLEEKKAPCSEIRITTQGNDSESCLFWFKLYKFSLFLFKLQISKRFFFFFKEKNSVTKM